MSTQGFRLDPSLLKLSPAALLKKYEASTPEERVRLGFIRRATPQEFDRASQPKGAPEDFGGAVYTSSMPPVVSDDTDSGIPVTPMPTGVSFQKQNASGVLHLDTSNPPTAELLQSGARTVGANMGTPAQSGTAVPLFFPGETSPRDVPYEEMHDNLTKYGAKPGVIMKFKDDPDQKPRAVPADQVQEASKAGGTIIPLGEQPVKQPGFWQRAYENSGLQGMVEKGKELYNDPDKLESLPYDLLSGAVTAQAKQFPKALEAAKSGDLSTAAGRTLAGVTPIVGPMAADTGEKVGTDLGTGNYAGAAGDVAGLGGALAAPKVIPQALQVAGKAAGSVGEALQTAGGAFDPDLVGLVSPRAAHAMRLATKTGKVISKLAPAAEIPSEAPPAPTPPQAPPDVPPSAAPVDPNPSPGAAPLQMTPAVPKALPEPPDLEGITSDQTAQAGGPTSHPDNLRAYESLTQLADQRKASGLTGNAMGYSRAARAIRDLPGDQSFLAMTDEDLADLPGIGPKTLPLLQSLKSALKKPDVPSLFHPNLESDVTAEPQDVQAETNAAQLKLYEEKIANNAPDKLQAIEARTDLLNRMNGVEVPVTDVEARAQAGKTRKMSEPRAQVDAPKETRKNLELTLEDFLKARQLKRSQSGLPNTANTAPTIGPNADIVQAMRNGTYKWNKR